MTIEKFGAHAVIISAENSNIYINLSSENAMDTSKVAENALVLGKVKDGAFGYVITEPGEYEVQNVGVIALENREVKDGAADFYEVEVEGVVITWQADPAVEIDKDGWEILTDTHILLLNVDELSAETKLDKFISKHNPHRLIILGDKSQAEKLTGIPVKETNKKFKFASKDFSDVEFTTESVQLG